MSVSATNAPAKPLPVLGHIARDISRDINVVFYLLTIALTVLVLAVKTWGLVALTLTAITMVPVVFVLLIWVTLP
jgi:hypothetical protein